MPAMQRVHLDKMLTNISIGYKNEAYIADKIFASVAVEKQSDRYYVFGMDKFRQHQDLRAPGTEAREISWNFSDDTYFTEGHALRTQIADEEIMNADDGLQLEAESTQLVQEGILLNKEVDAAAKVMNPNSYHVDLRQTMGAAGVLGATTKKWSDYTNSDPRLDIAKAKQAMHKKAGVRPNTLIISEAILNVLLMHPKLAQMIQYVEVPVLAFDQLKVLLGVENILVGSAMKSTVTNAGQSTPGAVEPLNYIWGNSAVLAYIAPSPGRRVISLGYSFNWNQGGLGAIQTRKWYEISRKATVVESEYWYAHKIISPYAAFIFVDAVDPLV